MDDFDGLYAAHFTSLTTQLFAYLGDRQEAQDVNSGGVLPGVDLAPDLDIVPVVQGTTPEEYERCRELFWRLLRIDLAPLPGLGSAVSAGGRAPER